MKKLNKYIAYIDDGEEVFKVAIPAKNEKEAIEYCKGNGEVISIRSANGYDIDLHLVSEALRQAKFEKLDIDFILRTLQMTGIAE